MNHYGQSEVILVQLDAPEAAPDQEPDDLPAALEIDPCSSCVPKIVKEPNFDAYVALTVMMWTT